jgi:triosephosphate isomerase
MNKTLTQSVEFCEKIQAEIKKQNAWIAPPICNLQPLKKQFSEINFGSQNVSSFSHGAYTGEVSASMLKDLQVSFCIVGHSERRKYFHETDEIIAKKMDLLVTEKITPILCVGETLTEKENQQTEKVLFSQLEKGLQLVKDRSFDLFVAYEPVWAVGSSIPATPDLAEKILLKLQAEVKKICPHVHLKLLYGGSVNQENIDEYLKYNVIDGVLVGGAALEEKTFKNFLK